VRALDLQTFPFFFFICFPLSIYVWSVLLLRGGFAASVVDMPWEFRLAARMTDTKPNGTFAPMAAAGPLVVLGIINSPVLIAFVGPYGPIGFVAGVAYIVVHLMWLLRIRRAIRRTIQP
jgi:hypothetical protein